MSRRSFLKSVGLLGGASFTGRRESQAGGLSLGDIDVIDVHVHPPQPMTLRQSYDGWNSSFVDALLPAFDYPQKEELREKLGGVFKGHLYRMPRQIGYYNYMARVYGVEPTLEGFDSVLEKKLKGDFSEYISSILDRERIPAVVLQSRSSDPVRPESAIPRHRFVWTYSVGDLIQPTWPQAQEARELGEVLERVDFDSEARRRERLPRNQDSDRLLPAHRHRSGRERRGRATRSEDFSRPPTLRAARVSRPDSSLRRPRRHEGGPPVSGLPPQAHVRSGGRARPQGHHPYGRRAPSRDFASTTTARSTCTTPSRTTT